MSDPNPYQSPDSDLNQPTENDYSLKAPRRLSFSEGWNWIVDGFNLFKKAPGEWIGMMLLGFIIMIVLSFVPVLGQLALSLSIYVWVTGLMLACRDQDDNKSLQVSHLFAGFSHPKLGELILLALIMNICSIVIMALVMGSIYFSIMSGDTQAVEEMRAEPLKLLLNFLIAMLFIIPLTMAAWFAPALMVLNNVSLFDAIKLSFRGCLINIFPFLFYGLIMFVLTLVAILPMLLGFLILFPVIYASIYTSYKAIFITESNIYEA